MSTNTEHALTYAQARRNETLSYAEILLVSPFIVVAQQYVPVLATRLGASPLLIGLITSGSALVMVITAALSNWYARHGPQGMRAMSVPLTIFRTILIWIPLVLFLPDFRAEALVAITIFLNIFAGFSQITFVTFLPRFTWRDRLPTLLSGRWTALGIGMAVSTPALGAVLDAFPLPMNYVVACAIAIVATIASSVCLYRIQLTPLSEHEHKARTAHESLRARLTMVVKHKPALHYLAVTLFTQLAINAAGPLVTLRLVRELNANDADFGITTAVFWASLTVASVIMPVLVRRYGERRIYAAAGVGLAIHLVIIALAQNMPTTWIASIFGGVASVMFQVTQYSLAMESAPPGKFEQFISTHTAIMNFGVFAGPLLMTGLASVGLSVVLGLAICAVARAVSMMAVLTQPTQAAHATRTAQ